MSWTQVLEAAAAVVALLNLAISVAVARSQGLSFGQKLAQCLVVWLLPPLGALLIGLFMWTQRGNAPATGYPSIPYGRGGQMYASGLLNNPTTTSLNSSNTGQ